MSDFKVLSYEYLEANKDSNCYEFKKTLNIRVGLWKTHQNPSILVNLYPERLVVTR